MSGAADEIHEAVENFSELDALFSPSEDGSFSASDLAKGMNIVCGDVCKDEIEACGGETFNDDCADSLVSTFAAEGTPPGDASDTFMSLAECIETSGCFDDDDAHNEHEGHDDDAHNFHEGHEHDDGDDDVAGAVIADYVIDQLVTVGGMTREAAIALVEGLQEAVELSDDFNPANIFEVPEVAEAIKGAGVSEKDLASLNDAASSTDFEALIEEAEEAAADAGEGQNGGGNGNGGNGGNGNGNGGGNGGSDDDDDSAASVTVGLATLLGLAVALF